MKQTTFASMAWAAKGRETRPDLKVGICGEHGGDPFSIHFCHHIGITCVSCSGPRVPVARQAAAQAKLLEGAYVDPS
jgi:pyruvate,orthophosphate dikinase